MWYDYGKFTGHINFVKDFLEAWNILWKKIVLQDWDENEELLYIFA